MPKLPASVGRHADLSQRFPQASAAFLRLNGFASIPPPAPAAAPMQPDGVPPDHLPPPAEPQRRARARSLAKGKAEERHPAFYVVRVKSFRVRLIDTDNLVPKWHVDALRYAGVLPDDAPDRARIETCQEKVRSKSEERTEIEILIETAL